LDFRGWASRREAWHRDSIAKWLPLGDELTCTAEAHVVVGQGRGAGTPLGGAHQILVAEPATPSDHAVFLAKVLGLGVAARIAWIRLEPVARPLGYVARHVQHTIRTGPGREAPYSGGPAITCLLLAFALAASHWLPQG